MLDHLATYGPYVWGAYALFLAALLAEVLLLRVGRRAAKQRVKQARLVAALQARERGQKVSSGGDA